MVLHLRLWRARRRPWTTLTNGADEVLRLSSQRAVQKPRHKTRDVENPRIQHVGQYEAALLQFAPSTLCGLRRAGNYALRTVGKFSPGIVCRHGTAPAGVFFGSNRPEWELRTR